MHNIERWSSGHWIFFHVTQVLVQHSFPFGAEWINKGGKCAGSVFFFFCFRKDAVFSTKSWSSQECPFYIFSGCQRHPSTCFFPSVLGITQCKQKPIFNINLSFFLIYFLCGKNGFFFFGVMRVLGISGELEKIDKSERLFIPNTCERNARKEKKISWFKAVCFPQFKTQTKS